MAPATSRGHGGRAASGTIPRVQDSCPTDGDAMKVGVARETAQGERRVALVPEELGKLKAAGLDVLVERGAGAGAMIPDQAYADAGATVVDTAGLYGESDAVLRVQKPSPEEAG